jgi:hypothetical protein
MKRPIDPFGRKMIHGSFVYGGVMLVMFAVLTVVYLYTRPRCSDRVLAETLSPDKHWTATLMERRGLSGGTGRSRRRPQPAVDSRGHSENPVPALHRFIAAKTGRTMEQSPAEL